MFWASVSVTFWGPSLRALSPTVLFPPFFHRWFLLLFCGRYKYLILMVSDQKGVSLLYIILEIHHSGWEPSYYSVDANQVEHPDTNFE